jgi:uncharacterized protein (TIGR02246 family)
MMKYFVAGLLALLLGATIGPARAGGLTEADLMRVAIDLGARYDAGYAAKDPAAMARVYAEDGVLISPPGPIVRGRQALTAYYTNRFAAGARKHAIRVLEVHVQGEVGYGINQFSVLVPNTNGTLREESGTIVAVYRHDADGWHMALVAPSVPETASHQGS